MIPLQWPMHDPGDNRVYGLDWGTFLKGTAETISTSSWTLPSGSGAPTNPGSDQGITGTTQTYVRLTGGVNGQIYDFVNTITTNLGNISKQVVQLPVSPA